MFVEESQEELEIFFFSVILCSCLYAFYLYLNPILCLNVKLFGFPCVFFKMCYTNKRRTDVISEIHLGLWKFLIIFPRVVD